MADLAIAALHASVNYLGPNAASSDAVLQVAEKFHTWLKGAVPAPEVVYSTPDTDGSPWADHEHRGARGDQEARRG